MQSNKEPEGSTLPPGSDGFVQMMQEAGVPLTRENYLDLIYFGDVPEELSAEEESDLPEMFRQGQKQTAEVDPRTLPVWRGGPVRPGGIGVPPKKPT